MADFTPKKVKGEASTAKGSNPKIAGEDSHPPTLYLHEEHLKKLGIHKMPATGAKLKFHAVGHVGSTSENQDHGDGGKTRRSMTLHLHKMDMGTGHQSSEVDEESQKAGMKSAIDKSLTKQESKD